MKVVLAQRLLQVDHVRVLLPTQFLRCLRPLHSRANMASSYQSASDVARQRKRAEDQAEQAELQKYPVRANDGPGVSALGVVRDNVYSLVRRW